MVESTLSLSYEELRKIIGRYLGYGFDVDLWDEEQAQDVLEIITGGLRKFYWPPIEHEWRFLRPSITISLISETGEYDLPNDFGSLACDYLTFSSDAQFNYVIVTSEQRIRKNQAGITSSKRPEMVAVRPKSMDGSVGQRFELLVWPTPDNSYTLEGVYEVIPFALDEDRLYPYGGARHAETIKASCLAEAEKFKTDARGVHFEEYMTMLEASIQRDRQLSPRRHGLAKQTGDFVSTNAGRLYLPEETDITYNGEEI